MNVGEGYIIIEISQKGGGQEEAGGPKKREGLLGCERSWGFPSSGEGSLLPGTLDCPILCIFPLSEQVVALSEPNFWTHSLQIHCDGPGQKTAILQLAPSVGKLLVQR